MDTINVLILPITTITGTLIGATVSYLISRRQFRMTVLSKNRQDWINSLRDNLAEYQSIMYNTSANVCLKGAVQSSKDSVKELMRANFIRSRVTLFLNPKETEHSSLLETMWELSNLATRSKDEQQEKKFAEVDKEFIKLATRVLNKEWKKVKKGE